MSNQRLTHEDRLEIKRLYEADRLLNREIAAMFGVHESYITIVAGQMGAKRKIIQRPHQRRLPNSEANRVDADQLSASVDVSYTRHWTPNPERCVSVLPSVLPDSFIKGPTKAQLMAGR